MAAPPAIWKITFTINFGERGWRENYYQSNQSATPGYTAAVQNLALARARILGGLTTGDMVVTTVPRRPTLVSVRIANVANPNQTLLVTTSSAIQNSGSANRFSTFVEEGYTLRIQDVNRDYRRILCLRGMPNNWIPFAASGNRNQPITNADALMKIADFAGALNGTIPQNMYRAFAMAVAVKPVFGDEVNITEITKTGAPLRYQIKAPFGNLTVGQKIIVSGTTGVGTTKIRGLATVLAANNTTHLYLLSKLACNACPPDPVTFGSYRVQVIDYPDIKFADLDKWGKRDTGGAFFATVGHRRRACC